jgi:hypothetical protein
MPKKDTPKADADPSNTVKVNAEPADRARLTAQLAVAPSIQATSTIKRWSHVVGDLDVNCLIAELRQQAETASNGNLKRQEATLAIQVHTLDTIFNELARRSWANVDGGYVEAGERYMRLALKAQSQCRTTIETLYEMKNPKPVAFVQQANIATGPQQVNNAPNGVPARAEKVENLQNKLLEQSNGNQLDGITQSGTIGSDPAMATVGAVNGPDNVEG